MADFDKISINRTYYNVRDTTARQQIGDETTAREQADTQLQSDIDNLTERVSAANPQNIVTIGDSYATGEVGPVTGWPHLLCNYLGMTEGVDFFIKSVGGSGFTKSGGQSWAQMVQDIAETMTGDQRQNTAKVLFCGGYNDNSGMNEGVLATAISAAKAQFPNAKVYVACVGWSTDPGMSVTIANNVVPVYAAAPKYGAIYVTNSQYSMHDYSWFQPDGFHPTQDGENHIAQMMAEGLLTGVCSNIYPLKPVSFTNGSTLGANITGWAKIDNGNTTLFFNNSVEFSQIADNVPLSAMFELGTLVCDYVRGINTWGYLSIANDSFFTLNGKEYNANMTLSIMAGKINANILGRVDGQPGSGRLTAFYGNLHGCTFPTEYV